MAEKILDKKGQKTPSKGGTGGHKPQDKAQRPEEASKKGHDHKKR